MKLIIAKAVYYSSLALAMASFLSIVILVMYWLLSNPQAFQLFVSLLGLVIVFVGSGLVYGSIEKYLQMKQVYRNE